MKQSLTKIAFCLILLLLPVAYMSAQSFDWARGGGTRTGTAGTGGDPHEATHKMCTDPNGNVYAISVIASGAAYADTFYSSWVSTYHNVLVSSYTCDGRMRWAKYIYSSTGCDIGAIACDGLGNVYLGGNLMRLYGSASIGYDTVLSGTSYFVTAVIQLDTSGHLNWIRYVGDNTLASFTGSCGAPCALVLDRNNIIHYIKPLGSGLRLTGSTTSIKGTYDFTYNTSGTLLDTKRLQLDSINYVSGASLDTSTGKLYVHGINDPSFSTIYTRTFIAAYDTNRNLIWMDTSRSSSLGGSYFGPIIADGLGHLYITGGAGYATCIYRSDTVSNALSGYLSFIMKTDTGGNKQWLARYSGTISNGFQDITLAPQNKLVGVGGFLGQVETENESITSYAGETGNPYFTVLDTAGGVVSLTQLHGNANYDGFYAVAADKVGNVYMGGQVGDSVWIDSTGYRSHGGSTDLFVMKYGVDCNCTSMPIAWFDTARSGTGGATVAFSYTGTTAGIDSIRWYFGDGATSTSFSPTHTYSAIDTYFARVYIYSPCGNDRHYVDVALRCLTAPTAGFSTMGITASRTFTYTGSATGIDSIVWNFGDGATSRGATVSHTYASTGSYLACATAYNPCGSDSSCSTISIPCLARPTASYSLTGTATTKSFTYTGTTVSLDSVVWKFGDGTRATGTTASHTYTSIGTFTACVYAYNPCGMDSSCTSVVVPCLVTPTASFTHSGIPATSFSYTGTTAGVDSIAWHFGDGSRGPGASTTHTYSAIDTVTACVIAYSRCGNDSACAIIYIPCLAAPVAGAATTGSAHAWTFTYTGTTPSLDSLTWRFGDGTTGYGGTISHTFSLAGTYNVCASAYNHCGWDSACITVVVPCDTVTASFTDTGTIHIGFHYTGTTAYVDSIVWYYGDGGHDTGLNAFHGFIPSGTYHVCVIAYSGCTSDSACRDISVIGLGVGDIPLTDIQVFPNPARDEVSVTGIVTLTQYRLLSVTGVSLESGTLNPNNALLPINHIATGVYILELSSFDGRKQLFRILKM